MTDQKTSKKTSKVFILRVGMFSLLMILAVTLGASSYVLLKKNELTTFKQQYYSLVDSVSVGLDWDLKAKIEAARMLSNIFKYSISDLNLGTPPFIIFPGYDEIMSSLNYLASVRAVTFNILLTNITRKAWEKYAWENVDKLRGPIDLKVSKDGSWTVRDGIYNKTATGKLFYADDHMSGSSYPYVHVVSWQNAPIAKNYKSIMYDAHSNKARMVVIDRVLTTKQGGFTDLIQLVQDTSTRPSSVLYSPMFDNSSNIIGISGMVFSWDDMLTALLPSSIHGVPYLTCVISTKLKVYTLSLSGRKITVLGASDLHDRRYDKYKKAIAADIKSLSSISAEDYLLTIYPTNEFYELYVTNLPINVSTCVVAAVVLTAFVVFLYDTLVTAQERFLIEQEKNYKNEIEFKRMFVNYISHEIRTPLNAVTCGLELLQADVDLLPNNSNMVESVLDSQKSCEAALCVVNDFLTFDKLEASTLLLEKSEFDAWVTVKETVAFFRSQAKRLRIDLQVYLHADSSQIITGRMRQFVINADKHKFIQVLRNMISNALKFTTQDGKVKVRVKALDFNNVKSKLIIEVVDTGAGLTTEQQNKLFKSVIQFDAGKLQKGGGSGLGLYVCQGIMKMHDGFLSVESEGVGLGSTFMLTMPCYVEAVGSVRLSLRKVERNNVSKRVKAVRALVVDDGDLTRKMVVNMMQRLDCQCQTAEDGTEAVEKVRAALASGEPFDLVLSDYEMPNLNGPQAIRQMRQMGYTGKVIGVTGHAEQVYLNEFFDNGANTVLVKPLSKKAYVTLLDLAIDREWHLSP